MGGGTIAYCLTQGLGFKFMGLHQITIGITVSLAFFLLGAYLGKPQEAKVLQVFFPESHDPDPKDWGMESRVRLGGAKILDKVTGILMQRGEYYKQYVIDKGLERIICIYRFDI